MTKTTTITAMFAALTLATTAQAQTPPDPLMFLNVSAGGQLQSREFSGAATFDLFNETGVVSANQTVGSGFVFDATAGYRFMPTVAGAIGISTFNGNGSAAAIAAIPSPLFFNSPTLRSFSADDYGDMKQSNVAVNFQIVWMKPITPRFDLSVFGGPSIIRVRQDIATGTASQNSTAAIESQSGTTAKAGTVGADLSYRLNDRYGVGGFIRYLGGQVGLPAVSDLTVGGVQIAGGVRVRF